MVDGYCEPDDVRKALQKRQLDGPTKEALVEPAITGVSSWFRKESGRHFYDSTGASSDVVGTSPRSISNTRLDVPSSPHAQRGQIHRGDRDGGVRYPVTTDGPYARINLPHGFVDSLTRLAVRDRAGDTEDWVASSDYQEGVGEDYYVREEDQEGRGRSYLYVRAASIGPRRDFAGVVTVDYDYGLDEQSESWDDVRRGIANLAAAQVVSDDDVLTAIPDQGQLVGVSTQYDQHVAAAIGEAWSLLDPYL